MAQVPSEKSQERNETEMSCQHVDVCKLPRSHSFIYNWLSFSVLTYLPKYGIGRDCTASCPDVPYNRFS